MHNRLNSLDQSRFSLLVSGLTLAVLLPIGCMSAGKEAPPPPGLMSRSAPMAEAEATGGAADSASDVPSTAVAAMAKARKLIRKGSVEVEVESFASATDAVRGIADQQGGFVSNSSSHKDSNDRHSGSLTLRIPAETFDATVAAVAALGEVERTEVNTEDVTRAYADLETRLSVKRQTAARLRAILERAAGNVQQILEVEREISRVVEEIESMEGQRRFFDAQVAMSTLTVHLFEPNAAIRSGSMGPLQEALHQSLEVLSMSLAAIIYIVVFLAPWAAITIVIVWLVKRWRRKKTA